jgi:hypothetical protein
MTEVGDRAGDWMPACDTTNPAELEAFYGPWGYAEHWRKVCLANCRELVRAGAVLGNQKVTESRIDDLARTHGIYLQFLTDHLHGRRIREEEVRRATVGAYGR